MRSDLLANKARLQFFSHPLTSPQSKMRRRPAADDVFFASLLTALQAEFSRRVVSSLIFFLLAHRVYLYPIVHRITFRRGFLQSLLL
jgi:hypothetical protein